MKITVSYPGVIPNGDLSKADLLRKHGVVRSNSMTFYSQSYVKKMAEGTDIYDLFGMYNYQCLYDIGDYEYMVKSYHKEYDNILRDSIRFPEGGRKYKDFGTKDILRLLSEKDGYSCSDSVEIWKTNTLFLVQVAEYHVNALIKIYGKEKVFKALSTTVFPVYAMDADCFNEYILGGYLSNYQMLSLLACPTKYNMNCSCLNMPNIYTFVQNSKKLGVDITQAIGIIKKQLSAFLDTMTEIGDDKYVYNLPLDPERHVCASTGATANGTSCPRRCLEGDTCAGNCHVSSIGDIVMAKWYRSDICFNKHMNIFKTDRQHINDYLPFPHNDEIMYVQARGGYITVLDNFICTVLSISHVIHSEYTEIPDNTYDCVKTTELVLDKELYAKLTKTIFYQSTSHIQSIIRAHFGWNTTNERLGYDLAYYENKCNKHIISYREPISSRAEYLLKDIKFCSKDDEQKYLARANAIFEENYVRHYQTNATPIKLYISDAPMRQVTEPLGKNSYKFLFETDKMFGIPYMYNKEMGLVKKEDDNGRGYLVYDVHTDRIYYEWVCSEEELLGERKTPYGYNALAKDDEYYKRVPLGDKSYLVAKELKANTDELKAGCESVNVSKEQYTVQELIMYAMVLVAKYGRDKFPALKDDAYYKRLLFTAMLYRVQFLTEDEYKKLMDGETKL